jgi:hypothetical protein
MELRSTEPARVSAPWWVGTPRAETRVACGPNQHQLRWDSGHLTPLDHPDPAVEAVLAEMGGEEPACLALARHWAEHRADERVLLLASRHPGDTLGLTEADVVRVRSLLGQDNTRLRHLQRRGAWAEGGTGGTGGTGQGRIEANRHQLGLIELLALDPSIVRRLQSEVAHNLSAAQPLPDANRMVLEAATVGRLESIARRWSGSDRPPTVTLGDEPGADMDARGLTVTVRPTWLAEIWGRYLGVVDHFLILDVHRIVEDRAEVTGVAVAGGEPARLTLRGPAPWHVEHRQNPAS